MANTIKFRWQVLLESYFFIEPLPLSLECVLISRLLSVHFILAFWSMPLNLFFKKSLILFFLESPKTKQLLSGHYLPKVTFEVNFTGRRLVCFRIPAR